MQQQASDKNQAFEKTTNHGPQGVDKAPGEETPQDTTPFLQESQKGKKNDGDPAQKSDQPVSQKDL